MINLPPTCNVTWSIEGDDLGGATIGAASGEITPGTEGGELTIKGTVPEASNYFATTTLFIDDGNNAGGGSGGGCSSGSCSSAASAGSGNVENGSVSVWISMGTATDGESAGNLRIHEEQPTATLSTPASLQFNIDRPDVEVIKDSGTNLLRQILSPEALADIIVESPDAYRIDFYPNADAGLPDPVTGIYTPTGTPIFSWQFVNPDPATDNQLDITKSVSDTAVLQYHYDGVNGTKDWTLITSDLAATPAEELRREEVTWVGSERRYVAKDTSGTEVYRLHEQYTTLTLDYGNGVTKNIDYVTSRAVDPFGGNLVTTRNFYTSGTGKVGKLKSVLSPDGSWTWYDYDIQGRMSVAVSPWQNVPYLDPPNQNTARATYYDYTPHPNIGDTRELTRPRTVTEKILGTTVQKTFYAYIVGPPNIDIEQRCQDPAALYNDSSNLVTTTTYDLNDPDKIASIVYPDGRKTSYTYETGTYSYDSVNPQNSSFVPGAGTDKRTLITYGTSTSPNGVPFKTTREMAITDELGHNVLSETYAYDGVGYSRIDWTVQVFDERGRVTDVYGPNDSHSQTVWGCCGPDSVIDEIGIRTEFVRDPLGRVTQETKKGVVANGGYLAQSDIVTSYTYDAYHRILSTTVGGGTESLTTSRTYDLAGRVKTETDEAELVTSYLYWTTAGRHVHVTMPGGTSQTTDYFRDGRIQQITGNAQVSLFYDYGVETDGTQWTQVMTGDGFGPTVKTFYDLLGRKIREERIGLTTDDTHRTYFDYNPKDQLVRRWSDTLIVTPDEGLSGSGGRPGGSGTGGGTGTGPGGGSGTPQTEVIPGTGDTLYEYDDLGNLTRTATDVDHDALLDLSGPDRVTDTDTSFFKDASSNDWWSETVTTTYPNTGSTATKIVGKQRQKLTGLPLNVTSFGESEDIFGNITSSQTSVVQTSAGSVDKLVTQTITSPASSQAQITVTRNGLLQTTTTQTGLIYSYLYDGIGRRVGTTDPRTGTSTVHYNTLGQVDWVEDAQLNRTNFTYDSTTGRRASVTNPEGKVTYYSYIANGLLYRIWGDVPQPVQFGYHSVYRHLTELWTYRGGTGWNGASWPTNPGTPDVTQWDRNSYTGLLTAKTYADGSQTQYEYTSGLALDKRIWARNAGTVTTTYGYDTNTGQLLNIDYSDATPDVSFTYDRLGRIATVSDALGTRTLVYNADLQLESEAINGAGQGLYDKVITRTYQPPTPPGTPEPPEGTYTGFGVGPDAATWNADYQATYGFDATGRFNAVTGTALPAGGVNYGYLAGSDLIERVEYKADATTVIADTIRSFESQRDLLTSVENKWAATTMSNYAYTNDPLGRRSSVVRTGTAFAAGHFDLYGYNARNELTGADGYLGTDTSNLTQPMTGRGFDYDYDPIGNRLTHAIDAGTPTDYTSNALNQYTQTVELPMAPETFTHDLDGNLTQDGAYDYTWDAENRLIGVAPASSPASGDVKLTFAYDYRGRRVRKLVETWSGTAWQTVDDLRFVYDDWNLVLELDGRSGNAILRKYAWGLDLSGTLHGAGGIGGLLAVEDTAGTPVTTDDVRYLCFYDANGNVGQLVDFTTPGSPGYGTLAAHYEYDPYGGTILSTGSYADTNPIRFSTKYYDVELNHATGPERALYYYGYRYYSPRTGRWLNRDPIGERGGVALYKIAYNNPINLIDAVGLKVRKNPKCIDKCKTNVDCCRCMVFCEGEGGCESVVYHVMRNRQRSKWGEFKREKDFCTQAKSTTFDCGPTGKLIITRGGKNKIGGGRKRYDQCCTGKLPKGRSSSSAGKICKKPGNDPTGGAQFFFTKDKTPDWMKYNQSIGNCEQVKIDGCSLDVWKCKSPTKPMPKDWKLPTTPAAPGNLP